MSPREKSIEKLKNAIKNKTLGMYRGAKRCRYYDAETDSCCAVGELVDKDYLFTLKDEYGDVFALKKDGFGNISSILEFSEWENTTGLTDKELIQLQNKHDNVITGYSVDTKSFEDYVFSLDSTPNP